MGILERRCWGRWVARAGLCRLGIHGRKWESLFGWDFFFFFPQLATVFSHLFTFQQGTSSRLSSASFRSKSPSLSCVCEGQFSFTTSTSIFLRFHLTSRLFAVRLPAYAWTSPPWSQHLMHNEKQKGKLEDLNGYKLRKGFTEPRVCLDPIDETVEHGKTHDTGNQVL